MLQDSWARAASTLNSYGVVRGQAKEQLFYCWQIPAGHLCHGKVGILCMYEPEKYAPNVELAINFQMEEEEDRWRKSILELAQATSAVLTYTVS